jgi:hypothetical protein
MVATWMGEEIDSSLQLAKGVTIRAKPGLILMKHAFRYIRSSGNMALMLPLYSITRVYVIVFLTIIANVASSNVECHVMI